MPSAKQIAANRRNAKISTGPQSEAGKTISKANAIKHGLTSKAVVLSDENQADFDQLSDYLHRELVPKGELENALVDRAEICLWRLKRAGRIEAEIFEIERLRQAANGRDLIANAFMESEENSLPPMLGVSQETSTAWSEARDRRLECQKAISERSSTAGGAFLGSTSGSDPLGKLYRYEIMIERSLHRALEQLERLQAKRQRLTTEKTTIIDIDAESVG